MAKHGKVWHSDASSSLSSLSSRECSSGPSGPHIGTDRRRQPSMEASDECDEVRGVATGEPEDVLTVVVENPISGEVIVRLPEVSKGELLAELQKRLPCDDLHSQYKFMCEAVSLRDLLESEAPQGELRLQAFLVQRSLLFDRATEGSITLSSDPDSDSDGATIASRHSSAAGGMAITGSLPWKDGVASFEVVIMEMEDVGSEGLEIGITGYGPDDGFSMHRTYAVLSHPSWVSSDYGCLWISGSKQHGADFQPWKDLVPKRLRPGDVVRLVLYVDSGDVEIFVNGASQARWLGEKMPNKLVVSEGQELFGLVGLRRPLKVACVRLPQATIPDMPVGQSSPRHPHGA
eukprot:s1469_g5.t1